MKKYLFLLVILLSFITPKNVDTFRNGLSVVTMEGDVITGNTLPRYGELCEKTPVRGSPADDSAVLYTLPAGVVVRLREQSHGDDRSWVMIAPANWVRLSALCKR